MMRYSVQPRDQILVECCVFLSFVKISVKLLVKLKVKT